MSVRRDKDSNPAASRAWRQVFAVLFAAGVLGASDLAQAQSEIEQAEEAYAQIDFEQTIAHANAAIEEGDRSPAEMKRLYELLGLSYAAERQEEEARDAYIRMIAMDPEAQVDTDLAPRIRSPFLEAKGYWSSRSKGFGVEARVIPAQHSVRVELIDPVGMATELRVLSRRHGEATAMQEQRVAAERVALVAVEALSEEGQIDYVVEVLDEHGNRIAELGTELEPRIHGTAVLAPARTGDDEGRSDEGGISPWVWIVGGVVLAGAVGVGLYLGLREQPVTLQSAISFE